MAKPKDNINITNHKNKSNKVIHKKNMDKKSEIEKLKAEVERLKKEL